MRLSAVESLVFVFYAVFVTSPGNSPLTGLWDALQAVSGKTVPIRSAVTHKRRRFLLKSVGGRSRGCILPALSSRLMLPERIRSHQVGGRVDRSDSLSTRKNGQATVMAAHLLSLGLKPHRVCAYSGVYEVVKEH